MWADIVLLLCLVAMSACASPSGTIEPAEPPGDADVSVSHDLTDGEPLAPGDRIDLGQADLTLAPQTDGIIGSVIAFPGDLDGDGYDEMAVGVTSGTSPAGFQSFVQVIWGGPNMAAQPSTSTLEGWYGDAAAVVLAGAGDVDGDGFDDLLVGIVSGGPNTVVLVYGGNRWVGHMDLRTAGPVLRDDDYDSDFGRELAGIGDTDGDGFDDFAIGAPSQTQAGALYVFHGASERLGGRLSAQAEASYVLRTAARDAAFGAVAPAGDANGDSLADFLAMTSGGAGDAFLVLGTEGRASGSRNVEGSGIRLHMPSLSLATTAGDLDGDGMDEIAVSASPDDSNAYVLYGRHEWPDEVDPTSDAELVIPSLGEDGEGCIVMARAGDFDGDGHADLLCFDQTYHHGAVVIGLGAEGGLRGTVDLAEGGLTLLGRDESGFHDDPDRWAIGAGPGLAGGSDLDGDGRDDLAVGFPDASIGAARSGVIHVLLGRATR